ncbi:alkaline phosphatase D family protein [Humisphaera borealis]|uniref:Alkaline phosphatase D family protein n=1 Tax=Humisphaera borealis TaxID=2807512 RepID=A0A7M2WUJ9_9BACT|nr:alkaline phosphatase D family protein [Humisphaera borealis]QOV89188.1 alkaline phosphatase D family protein [Humisphaera borealis]
MLDLKRIREAAAHEGGITRRLFLGCAASMAALPLLARQSDASEAVTTFASNPFTLGVASGDPDPSSLVLWTRLAPSPLEPDGGMPPKMVEVSWELAEDDAFKKIVRKGTTIATPQLGHSVHVEPRGLSPDRWYWYRFRAADAVSPVGRTRTMPQATASPEKLKFAFASCQHYETGLFTAYEQMARDDLDLVFHLGDYIYEGAATKGKVRAHIGREIETLGEYRVRHSLYRSDPLLHGMHATCPWFVTWDDHEFDNNCAGHISEQKHVDPVDFLVRRAAAYQAYYEMMPLRAACLPNGPNMRLYRRSSFGRLADFAVLDTRQYRTDQPNDDKKSDIVGGALDPYGTLLGTRQRDWLQASLLQSTSTWNVLAQQVMMGMVDRTAGDEKLYSMDQWPGYAWERGAMLQFLHDRRVPNPVVLTGDIHVNFVNDLRVDDRKPELPVVATEFVGTSISSGGNGFEKPKGLAEIHAENACVKYHNAERGYVRCTLTPKEWRSDFVVVPDVTKPGGNILTRASFVVEAGQPGAKPA